MTKISKDSSHTLPPNYFEAEILHQYQTFIDWGDVHFAGLLYLKKTEQGIKKVSFVTHSGNKIFNFQWNQAGDFDLIYCTEKLNKRFLIKLLAMDFELLLYNWEQAEKLKVFQEAKSESLLYLSKRKTKKFLARVEDKKLSSLSLRKMRFKRSEITDWSIANNQAKSFVFNHASLGLKLTASQIDK